MIWVSALSVTLAYSQAKSDTAAIHQILLEEAEGWNNGDAAAYSRHFSNEGTFTNIMGMFFTGHATFLERHDVIFKGMFKNTNFRQDIVSFRFIRPEVAVVETLITVSGFSESALSNSIHVDQKGHLITRLLQVMVKEENAWKIAVYHNVELKASVPVPEVR